MHSSGVSQDLRKIYRQIFKFPLSVHCLFIQFPTSFTAALEVPFTFFWLLYIYFCLFVCFLINLFFYFTLQYCWFCHTLTWIHHGCTCVPHPEPPSHLPPHPSPLGHPSAPAPSTLYHASNLDWQFISHMIFYMFQCHYPISSCPHPFPQSPKNCSTHQCLFCCLVHRIIVTIFLNSIYMHSYTVLVFFFLAYFTLYNRLQFHPPH